MQSLTITNLTKTYACSNATKHVVFHNFSLALTRGAITAFVGANGCGKTTLLNCIAGLTQYEKGNIRIDGQKNRDVNIGFVFQNYRESLLPWLKNIDNIACTLDQPSLSKLEKHNHIKHWADEHNITLPWTAYPYQCSGGQQQLLSIAREFINQPELLLMDEPFAALDYEKRLAWHEQVESLWEKDPTTVILISHDIEEAIYLADEVIVLGDQPTKIFGRHKINIPRPRRPVLLQSEIFFQYHRLVLQSFCKQLL